MTNDNIPMPPEPKDPWTNPFRAKQPTKKVF